MFHRVKIGSLTGCHLVLEIRCQIEKIPLPIPEAGIFPGEVKHFHIGNMVHQKHSGTINAAMGGSDDEKV
jgi:hypothetical protein